MKPVEKVLEAMEAGHLDLVKQIFRDHPHLLPMPWPGRLWLHYAVSYGHVNVIDYCLSLGENINQLRYPDDITAVGIAIDRSHVEAVKLLITRGADLTIGRNLI